MTFQETAICGAKIYYQYLCEHSGKGVAAIRVTEVHKTKDATLFLLKLMQHPHVLDGLQVEIKGVLCDPKDIRPTEYDKHTRTMTVYVSQDFQERFLRNEPAKIRIVSDLKFLVKRVGQWYFQYADRLAIPSQFPDVNAEPDQLYTRSADQDQLAAIQGILSEPFSYVWGAPGTGKTRFVLANCVLAYLRAGKRILITAPTNNAVEQTLYGVIDVLKEIGVDYERCLLRLGVASSEFAARYPAICEDRSSAKRLTELSDELLRLQARKKDYQAMCAQVEKYLAVQKEWDTFCNLKRELLPVLSTLEQLDTEQTALTEQLHFQRGKQTVLQNQKAQFEQACSAKAAHIDRYTQLVKKYETGLLRLLFPKRFDESLAQLSALVAEVDALQAKQQTAITELKKTAQRLSLLERDNIQLCARREATLGRVSALADTMQEFAAMLISRIQQNNAAKQILASVSAFETTLQQRLNTSAPKQSISGKELSKQLAEIEEAIRAIHAEKECIQTRTTAGTMHDRQIIAATVDTCIGRLLPNDAACQFSHIFLDEAGYCSLIKAATLTAYHAPLTFLGDHMQLPPICEMPNNEMIGMKAEVAVWAQSALYLEEALQGADIAEDYHNARSPHFCQMKKFDLSKTYRFGEALASILSQMVYRRPLEGAPEHETQLLFLPASKVKGKENRTNLAECSAILCYLKQHPDEEIGVLSPYKNQRALLASEIRRHGFSPDMVLTIHGSQGREWDTVLFSVVDTTDKYFTSIQKPGSNGRRLINTAVSRAKKKLILVCDCDYWMKQSNELIGQLLSVARPSGESLTEEMIKAEVTPLG